MNRLRNIEKKTDIPEIYQNTPIGLLLEYHNLKRPIDPYSSPQLLIGMCMDNRLSLHIPENFAFIIRSGGTNLKYNEFHISYAIAIGGIRHITLIGHTQCGMVNLNDRRDLFIQGLENNAGWTKVDAEKHFYQFSQIFEIGNEIDFILNETRRLRQRYSNIQIAPMIYRVENNLLYLIQE